MRVFPCLIALLALGVAQPSMAYLPSSDFLLNQWAQRAQQQAMQDLQADVETTVENAEGEQPEKGQLYIKRPEKLRIAPNTPSEQAVLVVQTAHSTPRFLFAALWASQGSKADDAARRIHHVLGTVGINTRDVSLGRHGDRTVYILGAKSWEIDKPQIWFDKDTMLPVRYRIKASKTAASEETRMNYDFTDAKVWFPSSFDMFDASGKQTRHSQISKVRINRKLPDTLFQI